MKICQKKNVSLEDETVLVQLDRRHTLKEEKNEVDSEDTHRKTTRANSMGSFEEGPSSMDVEAVTAKKQRKCARKQTVITESELSSSLLYKNRKAKINSDDESIEEPSSATPPEDKDDFKPRALQDPKLKPIPVSHQRPRKMPTCCWYFTIILVICIACLAVMAGIGGIVYMEYFATYEVKNIDPPVENDGNSLISKGKFQIPVHKYNNLNKNEPKIPESFLKKFIQNTTASLLDADVSRKVIVTTSLPKEDILDIKNIIDSKNSKSNELNKIKSSFVSENKNIEMSFNTPTAEHLDGPGWVINSNVPVSDTSVGIRNDKNQDLSDLRLNFQRYIMDKIPDGYVDEGYKQIVESGNITQEKVNSESEVSDSGEKQILSGRNFNLDEMLPFQGFESKVEKLNSDKLLQRLPKSDVIEYSGYSLPNDISNSHVKNSIDDNLEDNSFGKRQHSVDSNTKDKLTNHTQLSNNHIPKNESMDDEEHSIDQSSKDNSFDHVEHSIDNSLDPTELFIDQSPKNSSLDQFEHIINNSLNQTERFIDQIPKDNPLDHVKHSNDDHGTKADFSDHIEQTINSKDKSSKNHSEDLKDSDSDDTLNLLSEENSLAADQNKNVDDSTQLVFIRPAVESKAIPVPLAFLRRIGFDIKNINNHEPINPKDMDMKFSLAEALKYLRSLDTDNKLPSSREKTAFRKSNQKENGKIVTQKTINQEVMKKTKLSSITEREEYLNTLRKKLFEESLF